MKIKIYQVNRERDEDNVGFLGMDSLQRIRGSTEVNSAVYDSVFEGNVECKTLEDVYTMFNRDHPIGYKARSLSVSDVVEIVADEKLKPGFYFCDNIGFKEVYFEPEKTQISERFCNGDEVKAIEVLLVQPNRYPKLIQIEDSLEAMQAVVGGDIEEYMPFEDEVALICNEEGKVNGLPLNRAIYAEPVEDGQKVERCYMKEDPREIIDVIAGDFFIAGAPIDAESFQSLPPELAEKYNERFMFPEKFVRTSDGIKAIQFKPASKEMER